MILLIEKNTGQCWKTVTSSPSDVLCNPEVWSVMQFGTEAEMLEYIDENGLLLQEVADESI